MAKRRRAIVTLAVGPGFSERWHSIAEPHWRRYCDRHGYDLICLEEPLDTSERARGRSPAWQKCLILGQPFAEEYEQIVWVDTDILPAPRAPSIADRVPLELVGAVDEYSVPNRELHTRTLAKLYRHWDDAGIAYVRNPTPSEYHTLFGLPAGLDSVVQTGVMVLSPAHHRAILEDTYARYDDRGAGWNYEMRPLSYELQHAGIVQWIDPRFNYIWGHYQALHHPFLIAHPGHPRLAEHVAEALAEVHFLHFTGSLEDMDVAARVLPRARPHVRPARESRAVRAPVALFVHARPEHTRRLVELVRAANPAQVLVVADGPRNDAEAARCAETRKAIADADWGCELRMEVSDENLGLKRRVESGLDWVFDQVDEAIVLEDDCHPHPTFFAFCDELLDRYRDDPRVLTVSGSNFGQGTDAGDGSYFFSRYPLIWGWATWARAWRHYSPELAEWPELESSGWLEELFHDPQAVQYWRYTLGQRRQLADTWDSGWLLGSWLAGGLTAVSKENLVSNVGFGAEATNTKDIHPLFANLPTTPAELPVRHPSSVERDAEADAFLEDILFSGNLGRLFEQIRRFQSGAAR
ncbi:MAG TPA: hypothetical protein VG265_12325 [Gaiellaceae bacterium]|nr:hypothetical protein [Gaiellaceae bacterium]